jgi:hypothetical protein
MDGAERILNFRCSACDSTGTLLEEGVPAASREIALRSYLQGLRPAQQKLIRKTWAAFAAGLGSADDMLDALTGLGSADEMLAALDAPADTSESDDLKTVLQLISDVERRCTLHLTALRRDPKIVTPCCGEMYCFKCKIASHHDGMTCEEVQQMELEVECQFCPWCGIATQKTEGCEHIICICGRDWEWQGGDLGLEAVLND